MYDQNKNYIQQNLKKVTEINPQMKYE